MNRLNKSVVIAIDPRFSWVDWELYGLPESPDVAYDLNIRLKILVNSGVDQTKVRSEMHELMEAHRKVGSTDAEPMRFLESILDEIYGSE